MKIIKVKSTATSKYEQSLQLLTLIIFILKLRGEEFENEDN